MKKWIVIFTLLLTTLLVSFFIQFFYKPKMQTSPPASMEEVEKGQTEIEKAKTEKETSSVVRFLKEFGKVYINHFPSATFSTFSFFLIIILALNGKEMRGRKLGLYYKPDCYFWFWFMLLSFIISLGSFVIGGIEKWKEVNFSNFSLFFILPILLLHLFLYLHRVKKLELNPLGAWYLWVGAVLLIALPYLLKYNIDPQVPAGMDLWHWYQELATGIKKY